MFTAEQISPLRCATVEMTERFLDKLEMTRIILDYLLDYF